MKTSWKKWLLRLVLAVLALVTLLGLGSYWTLRRSLPILDGTVDVAGIQSDIRIERDALGVPSILSESMEDSAFALGFLHAQDRFFQMDLMRRRPVGELSVLFGKTALNYDISQRKHNLSVVAAQAYEQESPKNRSSAEAYAQGVNAGLSQLGKKPFEYYLLGLEPEPWKPEHSFQVILSMFFELHDSEAQQEYHMGLVRESMPEEWVAFLCQKGSSWDAPLEGLPMAPAPIPESKPATGTGSPLSTEEPAKPGSNNWAVGGALTETGAGLLANDMHLGINNPNTWYRADLKIGTELRITGVSLPGVPGIVSGSNGSIAWGFTNSFGDYYDLILLDINPAGTHYRTPQGWSAFSERRETIKVKDEADREVVFQGTEWGPVLTRGGKRYALKWTAHHAESLNFNLHDVMLAKNVDQALALAPSCGLPPQNLAVVDRDGNVAWTIIGKIPRREGYSGRFPVSWAKPGIGWTGWLSAEETPVVKNPVHHRVWTANARVVSGKNLKKLGDGGYDLGARAKQIKARLFEKEGFTEKDFLAIQLDVEAQFLSTWKDLFQESLKRSGDSPSVDKARTLLAQWEGYAAVESCAYLFVRNCRARIMGALLTGWTGPCKARDEHFQPYQLAQTESPVWGVLTARPTHLLPQGFKTWDDWLVAQIEAELSEMEAQGPLQEQVWGKRNTFSAQHVMSGSIPIVGSWLNSQPVPLPGDSHMPRVQGRYFGASERLIVSPGHENKGIFHMPGGQSAHPLSPYFLKGIDAWASGEPSPFLPGPSEHTLILEPLTK